MWNLFGFFILSCCFASDNLSKCASPTPLTAIYLTIGQEGYDEMHLWGGNHITLAGFHVSHNRETFLQKIPQLLKEQELLSKGWKPKKWKIEKWGKYWVVSFHSKTLDKIAQELYKQGFQKIKGPRHAKKAFHMTLAHIHTKEEAEEYVKNLKKCQWYITTAKKESLTKPMKWVEFNPL